VTGLIRGKYYEGRIGLSADLGSFLAEEEKQRNFNLQEVCRWGYLTREERMSCRRDPVWRMQLRKTSYAFQKERKGSWADVRNTIAGRGKRGGKKGLRHIKLTSYDEVPVKVAGGRGTIISTLRVGHGERLGMLPRP